ncbi:hypothetical protein E2C01_063117 [Portunus trituberculatus]|uniref:Uncharacterized protein n=1 Tax=Portunus trituberculatus TaxID=210409 RepID=A0A5B7HG18_PORTR|nr:hypothetical protein [Portunus trituberculatus]
MGGSGIFIGNFYPREDGLVRKRRKEGRDLFMMRWRDEGSWWRWSLEFLTSCSPGRSSVRPYPCGCFWKL